MATKIVGLSTLRTVSGNAHTVSSQVYHSLGDSIISLELPPGTAMSEQEIATRLGVSRTPVREAFIRLSREHMVIVVPQKGTIVSKISIARAKQERFLRESLEQAVIEKFILYQTQPVIDELRDNLAKQRQAIAQHDSVAFNQHDDAFHKVFFTATDTLLCYQVIRRNCFDYSRLRQLSTNSGEEMQLLNLQQHEGLLESVLDRDLLQAQAVLRKHVRRLTSEIDALSAQYPDYFLQEEA